MMVKHAVEKEDGTVVFQGVLEGAELAYVIELGMDVVIERGLFASSETHNPIDMHDEPEGIQ